MKTLAAPRGSTIWFAALLLITGLATALHWSHGPALGADDHGQYMLHARALLEGRPYIDIGFIHTRFSTLVAPIAEPPGLPVMIAGVFAVAGEEWSAARTLLVAFLTLFAFFVFSYWRRMEGSAIAGVVALWTVVTLAGLHALDTMMADLPFAAALWAVFLLADTAPVERPGRIALLVLAGATAFSFRMAALPLLPAAATALLLRGRQERWGFAIIGTAWTAAAVAVMWGLPAAEVLGSETLRTPSAIVTDAIINARAIWAGVQEWNPVSLPQRQLNLAWQAAVVLITMAGAVIALRQHPRRLAYISAAWYLLMLVMLPTRASRYLWPLFPLLTFAFVTGLRWLVGLVSATRAAPTALGVSVAFTVVGFAQDVRHPQPRSWNSVPDLVDLRRELASRSRGTTRPRVVVFSPRMMTWEDGYETMATFDAPNDTMLSLMREHGITHLVVGDAGTYAIGAQGVVRFVDERPEAVREVYRNATFRLLELR